jgi:HK97 family phage major capsid protein
MKTIRELLDERAQLITQARGLVDAADTAKRSMTAEEQGQFDALMNKSSEMKVDVDRRQKLEQMESGLGQTYRPEPSGATAGQTKRGRESEEYRQAYGNYLRFGRQELSIEDTRALQSDSGTLGGYLMAPMVMVNKFIQALNDSVYIRQYATVLTGNGESMGAPSLDADPADADWTAEIASVSEDTTMAFGRRELKPVLASKLVKISQKLMRVAPDAEQLVVSRLAYKFAITQEKAYLVGTGAQQPLGLFTASADGIPVARDVSTGNATTAITFDGLKEARFAIKAQYRKNARWLFHRDGVKQIAKIKDGEGNYLWQPAVIFGQPDTIEGHPTLESEYVPNTFTAGLYVGLFGDLSYYWIADSLQFSIQRLVELYAATNQVGLIGRYEGDGMPVLAEAFARVKLAP